MFPFVLFCNSVTINIQLESANPSVRPREELGTLERITRYVEPSRLFQRRMHVAEMWTHYFKRLGVRQSPRSLRGIARSKENQNRRIVPRFVWRWWCVYLLIRSRIRLRPNPTEVGKGRGPLAIDEAISRPCVDRLTTQKGLKDEHAGIDSKRKLNQSTR